MRLSVANRAARDSPPPVNVVDLMAHHAGEDALAGVGGLHGYVGHAGDHGGGPRNGHFQAVGMGAADDVVALKDGDGAGQVEVGPPGASGSSARRLLCARDSARSQGSNSSGVTVLNSCMGLLLSRRAFRWSRPAGAI